VNWQKPLRAMATPGGPQPLELVENAITRPSPRNRAVASAPFVEVERSLSSAKIVVMPQKCRSGDRGCFQNEKQVTARSTTQTASKTVAPGGDQSAGCFGGKVKDGLHSGLCAAAAPGSSAHSAFLTFDSNSGSCAFTPFAGLT
jgi:hypothetical protein